MDGSWIALAAVLFLGHIQLSILMEQNNSGLRSQALEPFISCVALRKFLDFSIVQVPLVRLQGDEICVLCQVLAQYTLVTTTSGGKM